MRLFLGFPLDSPTYAQLQAWQRDVLHPEKGFRWLTSDTWHITALFLGEVPDEKVDQLTNSIDPLVNSFHLQFERIRIIKRKGFASMVWAQYHKNDTLTSLYQTLHSHLSPLVDLPAQQSKVTPHITLARIKTNERTYPISWPAISLPELPCDTLRLYRSHLQSSGAKYETLATFPLNA